MLWQASIGEAPQVAYIDVVEEQTQGYIRCKDAASAQLIADMKADGITFTAVQGKQVRIFFLMCVKNLINLYA